MHDLPFRYLICLYVSGGLILVHALLQVFGFGHRPGLQRDPRRGPNALFDGITTAYSIVVALLAFGAVGLLQTLRGWAEPNTFELAAGVAAVVLLAGELLRRVLRRLAAEADAGHIHTLVGLSGVVTTAIPGIKEGRGTIRLVVHMRDVEYSAITTGADLPVGAMVRVAAVAGPGTVAVLPETDLRQVWKTFSASDDAPSSF